MMNSIPVKELGGGILVLNYFASSNFKVVITDLFSSKYSTIFIFIIFSNFTFEGSKAVIKRIDKFTENRGIHPANLTELMYLKFGERLKHTDVRIRGSASPIHNRKGKDSNFYEIPRNYFRLRVNPESRYYEFNAEKRDTLLTKFAGKCGTVTTAFKKIDDYMT